MLKLIMPVRILMALVWNTQNRCSQTFDNLYEMRYKKFIKEKKKVNRVLDRIDPLLEKVQNNESNFKNAWSLRNHLQMNQILISKANKEIIKETLKDIESWKLATLLLAFHWYIIITIQPKTVSDDLKKMFLAFDEITFLFSFLPNYIVSFSWTKHNTTKIWQMATLLYSNDLLMRSG